MPGKIDKAPGAENGHVQDITSIVVFKDHIYTGGADGKIKIWTPDLTVKKTLSIHDAYIYALAIDSKGKLYSCSCDGYIKYIDNPLQSDEAKELVKAEDVIQTLYCDGDILYSGDDKGIVTKWVDNKCLSSINVIEECKSLVVEHNLVYTARENDAIITEISEHSTNFSTKADIPGRAPLCLLGPVVNGHKSYLAFATRDGKGITLVNNLPGGHYKVLWTKENCHEMIINTICGDEKSLYTGAYDGKVKRWINIDKTGQEGGEVSLGSCVNTLAVGSQPNTCYTGSSDGVVRRLVFTDN